MDTSKFLPASQIRKHYAVSTTSLRRWTDEGAINAIRLPGGKHLYAAADVTRLLGIQQQPKKAHLCYARVSSQHQRADLERQVD